MSQLLCGLREAATPGDTLSRSRSVTTAIPHHKPQSRYSLGNTNHPPRSCNSECDNARNPPRLPQHSTEPRTTATTSLPLQLQPLSLSPPNIKLTCPAAIPTRDNSKQA